MTAAWPETPEPPNPFQPRIGELAAGTVLQRVHSNRFRPTQFNPGPRGAGRFHFFGNPQVPALYLAGTREGALAETLLHDIPVGVPAPMPRSLYADTVLAGLELKRPLQIAEFFGLGLRYVGVEANQLSDTSMDNYPQTRKWAHAAHAIGLDGIGWMSKRDNSARAYMLFGDRVAENDLEVVPGSGLAFASQDGFNWLVTTCAPLKVDVLAR
ncbi:RES family NAD+ phosphorylase [Arthrobacter sp. 2MCAF15]|uniref:RES family NAD+ phosphorylase n=1 Tax=Arthrobacter sp. 2MCAF15 TaxID=3232984 RepID=UPI003F8F0279